jgi:hypothetical protein
MSPSEFVTYRCLAGWLRVTARTVKRWMRDARFRKSVDAEKHGERWRVPKPLFQSQVANLIDRAGAFRSRASAPRNGFAKAVTPEWGNREREKALDELPMLLLIHRWKKKQFFESLPPVSYLCDIARNVVHFSKCAVEAVPDNIATFRKWENRKARSYNKARRHEASRARVLSAAVIREEAAMIKHGWPSPVEFRQAQDHFRRGVAREAAWKRHTLLFHALELLKQNKAVTGRNLATLIYCTQRAGKRGWQGVSIRTFRRMYNLGDIQWARREAGIQMHESVTAGKS